MAKETVIKEADKAGIEDGPKVYTKAEIEAFVAEIAAKVVDKQPAYLHSMLALNFILRQPNLNDLLDEDLREQLKDIWLKLKTTGMQLQEPPILFGIPDSAINFEETSDANEQAAAAK